MALTVKNPPAKAGDAGSIPGLGRSPGEENGKPLQYSCLENPMDRGTFLIRQPVKTINYLMKKTNIALIQTFNVLLSCGTFFSFVTKLHLKRREMAKEMCLCLLRSFMLHIFSLEHGLWGKMLFFLNIIKPWSFWKGKQDSWQWLPARRKGNGRETSPFHMLCCLHKC